MNRPLVSTSDSRIDVGELMSRVKEVTRAMQTSGPSARATSGEKATTEQLDEIDRALSLGGEYWKVGARVPPMARLRGPLKELARPLVKAALRVAELVTRDQRVFNEATLRALRGLREIAVSRMNENSEQTDIRSQLAQIQRQLADQQFELERRRVIVRSDASSP